MNELLQRKKVELDAAAKKTEDTLRKKEEAQRKKEKMYKRKIEGKGVTKKRKQKIVEGVPLKLRIRKAKEDGGCSTKCGVCPNFRCPIAAKMAVF